MKTANYMPTIHNLESTMQPCVTNLSQIPDKEIEY